MVDGTAQHLGGHRPGQIEMRGLRQRMHTRIGAPRPVDRGSFPAETGDRGFEGPLDREPVPLPLPADQPGAVIFDGQLVAGHGRTVPGAIGKPRRKAGASSGARPGRCSRSNRSTPSPQAIVS